MSTQTVVKDPRPTILFISISVIIRLHHHLSNNCNLKWQPIVPWTAWEPVHIARLPASISPAPFGRREVTIVPFTATLTPITDGRQIDLFPSFFRMCDLTFPCPDHMVRQAVSSALSSKTHTIFPHTPYCVAS